MASIDFPTNPTDAQKFTSGDTTYTYVLAKGYWDVDDSITTLGTITEKTSLAPVPAWTQQAKIEASDAQASDRFGRLVSISSDGNTAIVGALYEDTGGADAGAAYIFTKSGSSWSQQAKIQASDKEAGDEFGSSVSISGDGNTAIVGAYFEDTGATDRGSAYVFVRSGTTWTQQAKLAPSVTQSSQRFGIVSISSDGNTAVVGAYGENWPAGAVYIYIRSGTTWSQQARIAIGGGYFFGSSLSISGDGLTLAVGVGQEPALYIFAKSGTTWPQQAKITGIVFGSVGEGIGAPVSISSDGNTIIFGASREDTGATNAGSAYIFTRSGTSWSEQAKIQASDKEANDYFGSSVSISSDGLTAIVGAGGEDTGGADAGAAYIFKRSGSTWSQQAKIQASDIAADDIFSWSVSISGDGLTAIVGSEQPPYGTDPGSAYIFTLPNPTFDISQSSIFSHSGLTENITANFTNVPTTNDRTIEIELVIEQGATGYLPTAIQIDDVAQTFVWENGVEPTPSVNASDVIKFTLLRSSDTWTVLASLTRFTDAAYPAGGIALTDFSVGAENPADGDGGISYDNTTGVFTYTPPVLTGTLAELTEVALADLDVHDMAYPATTVHVITPNGTSAYRSDHNGTTDNPTLYVNAGETIAFDLTDVTASHPFQIQTTGAVAYNTGLIHIAPDGTKTTGASAQGKTSGVLYWKVPGTINGDYEYICGNHSAMKGTITIADPAAALTLTDLSVGAEAAASGDGGIAYDNTTGVFTYTPPVISAGFSLPSQTGKTGAFLTTDGSSSSWDTLVTTTVGLLPEFADTIVNTNPYGASTNDRFGYAVATDGTNVYIISADPDAPNGPGAIYAYNASTKAYLYTITSPITTSNFGYDAGQEWSSTAAKDGYLVATSGNAPSSVHIFNTSDGSFVRTIARPAGGGTTTYNFGGSVDTVLGKTIIGDYAYNNGVSQVGRAYLYDNATGNLLHTFENPNPNTSSPNDSFGRAVKITSNYIVIAAMQEDIPATDDGVIHIFDANTYTLIRTISTNTTANEYFGWNVHLDTTGEYVTSNFNGNQGKIYEIATGALALTISAPAGRVGIWGYNNGFAMNEQYVIMTDDSFNTYGRLHYYDKTTGSELFTVNNPKSAGRIGKKSSSMVLVGDSLFVSNEVSAATGEGEIYVIEPPVTRTFSDDVAFTGAVTIDGVAPLTLTDISVGAEAAASGDGGIAYDNTTGVFTYTPPVVASGVDAASVEAAGALMDSELTDIASIKALDQGVATTDSPTFAGLTLSGVPTAPTAAPDTSTTQIATTEFTTTAINEVIVTATNFVNRIYDGDGVTNTFVVTSGVTSESILVSDNGVVQRPVTDYSVSGTTLTFVSAPLTGSTIQIREIPAGIRGAGINTGKAIAMSIVFGG